MTAASCRNYNQWIGFKNFSEEPNISDLICWRNVLKHELKRKGLRQSPRSTPRPLDSKRSAKFMVIIEVLKSVYTLLTRSLK